LPYREATQSKVDKDFKSQIAGIPGAVTGSFVQQDDDARSTTSSNYRRMQPVVSKPVAFQRRHSVDAEIVRNSFENRLAMGGERPREQLDHLRSHFAGQNFSTHQHVK
jgi:hypothetical protein